MGKKGGRKGKGKMRKGKKIKYRKGRESNIQVAQKKMGRTYHNSKWIENVEKGIPAKKLNTQTADSSLPQSCTTI